MIDRSRGAAPIISVAAATTIALACGTNYAYSAWGPAFADHMKLSSTQQNLIGASGNIGMYVAGIPAGMFADSRGARPCVLFGSLCLGIGYFCCYEAYIAGAGSIAVPWLCAFIALTGIGACSSFFGALKTAALNFPDHRGTATAFPLAGFGLSAFFFSLISSIAFPDNTADLLLLFAISTFVLTFSCNFFLRVVPSTQEYIPLRERRHPGDPASSKKLHQRKDSESKLDFARPDQRGTQTESLDEQAAEAASLLSESSNDVDEPLDPEAKDENSDDQKDSLSPDIRGLAMLKHLKFYQLWLLLGLMTGIGLMTINNIGSDARALWRRWDDSASAEFIQHRQLLHVELLSITSCVGRLMSGIGSDYLVHNLHLSRFWCLVISASLFILAQLSAVLVTSPHLLGFVSGLTGLGYGFLFGCYPALVAETFGVHGMTQNWGFMTLSPVPGAHLFNLLYGQVYDAHSEIKEDGRRDCQEGIDCYRTAYLVTLGAAGFGLLWSLASVRYDSGRRRVKDR